MKFHVVEKKKRKQEEFLKLCTDHISAAGSMKIFSFLLTLLFFAYSQTLADLNVDKKALLDFVAAVPHPRKLNWSSSTRICASWVGVTCNANNSRVIAVHLPGVGLYGAIPSNTLGKMDALIFLSLRSNHLNGTLPSDLMSLPSLRYIYLQHNNFSGSIPSSISSQLNLLDLSFNSFTGNIPATLQNLTHLMSLSLQNNFLTGSIPELNISGLNQLNLSYNHLNGSVPFSLQKFPPTSFQGNIVLCGPPLNRCSSLPAQSPSPSPAYSIVLPSVPLKTRAKKKLSRRSIIAIAVGGSATFLFLLLMIMMILYLRKNDNKANDQPKGKGGRNEKLKEDFGSGVQDAEKNKLVFFEGCSYNFDLEDLLRASAEVLGKGSYGTTYKAILEEGTAVVVKRLKEVMVGKREFEQQMEIVGRVSKHPNVLPLRAYYYCKDEKLLVYDYTTAGSFSSLLHGNREIGQTALDWENRVKICLGTARGIAHIHSEGGGKLIHGNIKSSNVLLTQELQACVSDFGLSTQMNYPTVPSRIVGYRAPEVIESRKFTQKSDVYSFGVLLLEMLTGKAPIPSSGHDDVVDLPRWVQSVVREEWTAEVFDVELMRYHNIEEEMVQMLQVAMACSSRVTDMRPTMDEVVKMIEEIRPSDSTETKATFSNAIDP
ncbi:hypothetical protein K2173_008153 [Erythroxylum novogranatense]|uniref:Protein kinase domain-containing protein n=1 Tax=Erythroxylum novogranatense TaxID=1862640 RepID=A0AAV8U8S2_9ROSI|nr:hypothetical protein K2173_008153 [Erythroxylum novogranatense]